MGGGGVFRVVCGWRVVEVVLVLVILILIDAPNKIPL